MLKYNEICKSIIFVRKEKRERKKKKERYWLPFCSMYRVTIEKLNNIIQQYLPQIYVFLWPHCINHRVKCSLSFSFLPLFVIFLYLSHFYFRLPVFLFIFISSWYESKSRRVALFVGSSDVIAEISKGISFYEV